jgi:hypothetical protein
LSAEEHNEAERTGAEGWEHAIGVSPFGDQTLDRKKTKYQTADAPNKKYYFLQWIKKCSRKLKNFFANPKNWLEIAALVVLSFYTYYARQQSKTMSETLVEIKIQTESAKTSAKAATEASKTALDALTVTRDNFIKDQRPYIWFTNTGEGSPDFHRTVNATTRQALTSGQVIWTFHATNYGKTPAYKVRSWRYIKLGTAPFVPSHSSITAPTIDPPIPPGHEVMDTIVSEAGVEFSDFNSLLAIPIGNGNIYGGISIKGRFEYEDGSGNSYTTDFCLTRLNLGAVAFCRKGNEIK